MKVILKEYFDDLNERERKLVIIAGIFLGIFLFYTLIYSPIKSAVSSKKQLLIENKETLNWMEGVYKKHNDFNSPELLSSEKLLTVLSNSLRDSNLKDFAYQLEQTSNDDIRLSFANVPYNNLMDWLWSFCGRYGLSVKSFLASSKHSNGIVSVNVVLSQS